MKLVKDTDDKSLDTKQVSDKEAEDAFRTILSWMGEDPSREGLLETPKRVVKAFKEYFKGYKENPNENGPRSAIPGCLSKIQREC